MQNALNKWDRRFLEMAALVAGWSKDESSKVAAIIVDGKHRVVSMGFNGFARGLNDGVSDMARERKLLRMIHAEENALLFAHRSVESCTAYVTHIPCAKCCAKLIQAGITRIVVAVQEPQFLERWKDDIKETVQMVSERGVELDILQEE